MLTKIIEATNYANWGKFLLARYDEEWSRRSVVSGRQVPLIREIGWSSAHLWVLDLQTGEGALFRPGGHAHHDLEKHKIWVCPMFEPFLEWLYQQDLTDLAALPDMVELLDAEFSFAGYRRGGRRDALVRRLVGNILDNSFGLPPTLIAHAQAVRDFDVERD